jgi:Ras-related protein Rab-5C
MNYKLVLLGDTAVGKSCIVWRLVRDDFYDFQEPTIGSAFTTYAINNIRLDIWDTAGQERYKSLAPMYYRSAKIAVVVYDVTNKESLTGAKYWIRELKMKGPHGIIIALVGNKSDREKERAVTTDEVKYYAEEQEILFMETSAKKGINVNELFADIAAKIPPEEMQEYHDNQCDSVFRLEKKSNHKSCCYSSSMM